MKQQWSIDIDGKSVSVVAKRVGSKIWLHLDGETICVEDKTRTQRSLGVAVAGGNGDLQAPMPGKITKILVQKDQAVKSGENILVMEAMKMEYTLRAPAAGVVEEILCQVGQIVPLGLLLTKIHIKK